ncbi:MAG: PIG-L family deacetylase [Planctomycetes bacterium]|nr:PIG-L family deacetylase [Planctomycetota bacterium]
MRVLVVAAHPDDEVLGCGGTVARWAEEGREIGVWILGEGVTSRYETRQAGTERGANDLAEVREHAARAASILGAAGCRVVGLPDNRFDSVDLLEVVKEVESAKREFDPDVVLTHHPGDLNVDHRVCHQAVATAFRPLPGERWSKILSFEVSSSTEWQLPGAGSPFVPTEYVELAEGHMEKKLAAMAAYAGEIRDWPHARSREALRALAKSRGSQAGCALAEAFALERAVVRLSDQGKRPPPAMRGRHSRQRN